MINSAIWYQEDGPLKRKSKEMPGRSSSACNIRYYNYFGRGKIDNLDTNQSDFQRLIIPKELPQRAFWDLGSESIS